MKTHYLAVTALGMITVSSALADAILYSDSPSSYPNVTGALNAEFGSASFPPLSETALPYYQVNGTGPQTVNLRFTEDLGGFHFNFGYYLLTPALLAIDTSTDAGKISYATTALAPGSASLIFDDNAVDPGATAVINANGGDVIGFFYIPDSNLSDFQTNQGNYSLTGLGSAYYNTPPPLRWPFFSFADANPGGEDQLMSISGTSAITSLPTTLLAWEDLTRIPGAGSDSSFTDMVVAIDGLTPVGPVPEPGVSVLAWIGALLVSQARRR